MRPVNLWPGNNSPPGVQPRPTNRIRPRLFLSGFCRAGMVEERNLPAGKTAGRSATVPAQQYDPSILGPEITARRGAGMVEERNLPAGKTAGRSATVPAQQYDPSILGPEITARRGCNPGLQTGFGRGYSCRDFVGREWLRNETFPPGKRLEGLRPIQPDNPTRQSLARK